MDRQKQNDFSLQLEQEVSNQRLPAGLSFANLNCFCPCLSMTDPTSDCACKWNHKFACYYTKSVKLSKGKGWPLWAPHNSKVPMARS